MMTRILIGTNKPIMAKGLEDLLTAGGLEVAGICHDVFELFEKLPGSRADIAILDKQVLPAPEVILDLRRIAPQCQFLTWPEQSASDSPGRLADALNLMTQFSAPASPATLMNLGCNERERELITLVGHGLNNEEIASSVGSDPSTVHKRLKDLSEKLGTQDRCELALYGLSTLGEKNSWKDGIETA
jgi:DNA-binding NarL/FixJ family response regulator